MKYIFSLLVLFVVLAGCSSTKKLNSKCDYSLRLSNYYLSLADADFSVAKERYEAKDSHTGDSLSLSGISNYVRSHKYAVEWFNCAKPYLKKSDGKAIEEHLRKEGDSIRVWLKKLL